MFYYSDDSLGLASLQAHADAMTLLAPQCYGLDRAGALHGQLPAGVLDVTRRAGLPLMPLVTNPGFDRSDRARPAAQCPSAGARRKVPGAACGTRSIRGLATRFRRHRPRGQVCLHTIRGARGGTPASRPSPAERRGGAALFRHLSRQLRRRVSHRRVGRGVRFPRARARCRFPGAHGL